MIRITIFSKDENKRKMIYFQLCRQEGFCINSMGKDGFDVIRALDHYHPDIIIMDFWLGDVNGTNLAPIIKRKSPGTKIIAIGSTDDAPWIKRAMKAGITGFLLQEFDIDKIANAVICVNNGGLYLSSWAVHYACIYLSAIDSILNTESTTKFPQEINDTERYIIIYIAAGYSDKEIAEEMNIAVGTVRNCMAVIKRKTGQKNRVQIVIYLIVHGMVGFPLKKK